MADSSLQPTRARDDEIDLIELVQKIWRGRYIVLALFIVGAGLAAAYAYTATQEWTSVAYVVKPEPDQSASYLHLQRIWAQADAQLDLARPSAEQQADQTPGSTSLNDLLFAQFISVAAARHNRLTYLSQATAPAAKLTVTAPDKDQIDPHYTLSATAHTAAQAQKALVGYVDWVNKVANQRANSVFQNRIQSAILTVQNQLENAAIEAKITRQNTIDRLEHALHTAQLAGIKGNAMVASHTSNVPGSDDQIDNGQLFLLGENILSARLASVKQAGPVYPVDYYKAKLALTRLEALQADAFKVTLYSYQLPPTLPTHRDKPRRSLIVLLGAIVGILIGCFLVLVLDAFRSHRRLPSRGA